MLPKYIKQIQRRSRDLSVRQVGQSILVDSATEAPGRHAVTIRYDAATDRITAYCSCNWSNHVMAALAMMASRKGRKLSYWLTEEDAMKQRHKRFFLTRGGDEAEGIWITSRPFPREAGRSSRFAA
jgi:hypothetical protein